MLKNRFYVVLYCAHTLKKILLCWKRVKRLFRKFNCQLKTLPYMYSDLMDFDFYYSWSYISLRDLLPLLLLLLWHIIANFWVIIFKVLSVVFESCRIFWHESQMSNRRAIIRRRTFLAKTLTTQKLSELQNHFYNNNNRQKLFYSQI